MSVELDPVELGFRRPFNREVSQVLSISNPNAGPVAFKVKTTAPKQYCVRPNSGRIEPGAKVQVQVLLQAMKEDPAPDAKCRDKFLVQSVEISADNEFNNLPAVWSSVEQTSKGSIQEKKIRVVFLAANASSETATPAKVNGVAGLSATPSARSPSPDAFTPQSTLPSVVGPVSKPEQRPADAKNLGEIKREAHNPAVSGAQGTVAAAAANVGLPTTTEELKAQLAEANAAIARLTQSAAEQTGLRQRNTASSTGKSDNPIAAGAQALQQQAQAAGVPIQIVAGLCLLCFLLAYFFF